MAERSVPGRRSTTRRPAWAAAALLPGLAALLFVVACEGDAPGIFHTLATESERDNRNLHDDLTVSAVAGWNGHYYVAAHGMWSRPTDRGSWQEVARPQSRSDSTELPVLAMAQRNGTLCVGTEEGAHYATADPQAPDWRAARGVTGQVVRLITVPSTDGHTGEILAITYRGGLWGLSVSSDDCRSFSAVNLPGAAATEHPYDAFHDGSAYWLTVGNRVYTGAALGGGGLTRDQDAPEVARYRGVLCLDAGRCLFATHDGEIYERSPDGVWERMGQIDPPDDRAQTLPLTVFIKIDDRILIGTQGYGFYQFDVGDRNLDDVRPGPRSTSQLYRAHITVFARPRPGNLVFAGTAVDGLSSIEVATARDDTGTWDWE